MSMPWYETPLSKAIMAKKYFHENEDFQGFIDRVVGIFSEELQPNIREVLLSGEFFPAGRSLYGAGSKGKFKASMSNCYILQSPNDSIESIYDINAKMARIFSYGGGCGVNISNLRPKDARVNNAARTSSGAVSFLELFNTTGNVIGIHGRRAAEMVGLNCEHPDIEEFLKIKQTNHKLEFMNISILFTKPFMDAVKKKETFKLHFEIAETGETIERDIDAAKFFHEFAQTQWDWGDPGSIFIDRVRNYNLLSGYEDYKIEISNPCVSGDTLILTDTGYRRIDELAGITVNVWNGYRWSRVTPGITGHDQKMFRITLSNGMSMDCTEYHKFLLRDGSRKEAKDLIVGDQLPKYLYPIIQGTNTIDDALAYTLGVYAGDGTKGLKQIVLYGQKQSLVDYLTIDHAVPYPDLDKTVVWLDKKHQYSKVTVPDESYTIQTRLQWLAGLIDADGTRNSKDGAIMISSIDLDFIKKIQRMLTTLGIFSCINHMHDAGAKLLPKNDGTGEYDTYECQESYRLCISASNIIDLVKLGLQTHRVDIYAKPNRNASRFLTVQSIEKIDDAETVYCMNEPYNHTFIANGILTGNCAEFFGNAYNSCNLGSINLYHCVSDPFTKDARINWSKLTKITDTAVRALDEILDYGYELQPLNENRKCIDDWRSIGLGIMGLADMFVAMGLKYGSEESIATAEAVLHSILEEALRTSCKLAKEKGSFGKFDWEKSKKSPLIQMFPHLWQDIERYGLRNGTLLSIAPTGTLSLLAGGFSGGVEPIYKIAMTRTTHSMESERKSFTVFAKSVWDLMEHDGLPDTTTLEELYKRYPFLVESHDVDPMARVELQSAIQKFVDNAISSTVNLKESATPEDIEKIYMTAFDKGCKGITVFRDNCKRGSILDVAQEPIKKDEIELDSVDIPKRHRIQKVDGATYVEASACIKNFYVTVNHSENNKIFEVFTAASGGCQANVNTITRLISLLLRAGVKVDQIINELREAKCQGCQELRKQGKKVSLSCGNAIADALQKAYKELQNIQPVSDKIEKPIKIVQETSPRYTNSLVCPECGEQLKSEGRCFSCPNCGFSKCE